MSPNSIAHPKPEASFTAVTYRLRQVLISHIKIINEPKQAKETKKQVLRRTPPPATFLAFSF